MNKTAVFRLKLSSYSPNSLCSDVFPPCLYTGYLQIKSGAENVFHLISESPVLLSSSSSSSSSSA